MTHDHRKELFVNEPLEQLPREPQRPVENISAFVIDSLPPLLNEIRAGETDPSVLVREAEKLAISQRTPIEILIEQKAERKLLIVRLEILMLQAAIYAEGEEPGEHLKALVDMIAEVTERPASLTYEDVVINNPLDDIRTFTNGEIGMSEASFYNGHRYIEETLEPSVHEIQKILAEGVLVSTDEITQALEDLYENMQSTIAYTGTITKKMPKEHFRGVFRKYFGTLEKRGLRGPSGAFTARLPLIEYMLMGELVPDVDVQYQYAELQYFPLTHQEKLLQALESARSGKSVRQLLIERGSPPKAMEALQKISDVYRRFRQVHLKAVETHLPEVFEGKELGTGGEEVDFLQRRMDRDTNIVRMKM